MQERMLVIGNEAVGWGALMADCNAFFGYPITPQNETTEWFSREFPKRGKVFLQSQSEVGTINMLIGGAATGARVMSSTSGPGWGLMQEGFSTLAALELPCVVVNVQRGGPGPGVIRPAQMDYLSATRGGGQGGYKNIVLAPASVQETHDLVQLAFYLADKYRNPVVILSDAIIGQMAEPLKVKAIDFGPLPQKYWALRGIAQQKDGKRRAFLGAGYMEHSPDCVYNGLYRNWLAHLAEKYQQMRNSEVKYESNNIEDAGLILVAYGYVARVCKAAIRIARERGLKVGLIRPITLWPFPYEVINVKAQQVSQFLVVEDSLGQMIDDVEYAVQGRCKVNLVNMLAREEPTDRGMLLPDRVFEEIQKLL